ncbi:uncharacterized protein LAESUDRAFT_693025 [Laetiporus sulphureus 93-53]|uniref:Uncharacterized protein n=1 Tax=Laetiporus sulphureus 93-53 TaxID=1314785 RepID=A0A165GRU9_9APHY|nr:uncharacterized protein LAESUDRAFT_693025 [Laetiporus sulphureus 93-53]KZT10721.1 hypothetical protein LAESUDRAFT_693025 [Laetiporus sulphureus 93-53]
MSFPAILRSSGVGDRFAHLRVAAQKEAVAAAPVVPKKNKRDEKEGKRWVRRRENARFAGNAHIVPPSKRDYAVPLPYTQPTFPQPLPKYLSRNNAIPPVVPPAYEPSSANAGRFSMSLKGMRRVLRKSGPRTELLVKEVEDEILLWLESGGVMLSPDAAAEMSIPGSPMGSSDLIKEVLRTPLQLVWSIADDGFVRYVVHCCARYHEVVSFSKDTSGQRLTYLLRPNITRPNPHASAALETPPMTDLESAASVFEFGSDSDLLSESDFHSDTGIDSDVDGDTGSRPNPHLAPIAEASVPPSQHVSPMPLSQSLMTDDGWFAVDGGYADAEDSEMEQGLSDGVHSLTLQDADSTPQVVPQMRHAAFRSRIWERQRRSASSPSRSPARRQPQRVYRVEPPRVQQISPRRSFHDYLFG